MHKFKISDNLGKILIKLSKRDKSLYNQLTKKMDEVVNCQDVEHYKNLQYKMKDSKRAHIGHFVLVFQYNISEDVILFDDFDHHDNIYNKQKK